MRRLALIFGMSAAVIAGGALAQPGPSAPGPDVNVSIGPALQARADDFGARDLEDLRTELRDDVVHALARARFVIEDATPNRPTFAQLSRSTGLSLRSVGVGGARISGTLTGPDGATRPIRYQYFETDLWEERGASTWSDADRTFSMLASQLAGGHVPDKFVGPGPQRNGGHFGYPYIGE